MSIEKRIRKQARRAFEFYQHYNIKQWEDFLRRGDGFHFETLYGSQYFTAQFESLMFSESQTRSTV